MRTRLAVVVLVAVAGCGGSGTDELAGPTVSPAPAASRPTPAGTLSTAVSASATAATPRAVATATVVRDEDSGSTVHLQVGQRVRVLLEQGTWDPPTSGDESVLARRTSSGGYPTDQPVDAVFEALRTGTTDLAAQSDAACFHTEPRCLMPTQLWQVHVVVS